MEGTVTKAKLVRVVDGDTIRAETPNGEESLRILSLDTEESRAGSGKPETPWGHKAKEEAESFFAGVQEVVLQFPGNEPLQDCWRKHRGKYDRPLVYVYRDGDIDFQEHMIRQGYSPYFVKYGYAVFEANHRRYTEAERAAQVANIGVWNQPAVNGSEMRNYALLSVWWHMRAQVIDAYRRFRNSHPDVQILDPRLDWEQLGSLADQQADAKVFLELGDLQPVGGRHGLIRVGSQDRPFDVFIPKMDEPAGEEIGNLLWNRCLAGDLQHPRLSYAYLQGTLSKYYGRPQITITSTDQIADQPD